jgi:hypothetical protein
MDMSLVLRILPISGRTDEINHDRGLLYSPDRVSEITEILVSCPMSHPEAGEKQRDLPSVIPARL